MKMEEIVSLAKRRGFLFQSSAIYGGLNGFWDYGPLGVELKRNVKNTWWSENVTAHDDVTTIPGAPQPYEMTGLDCSIIMHPQIWKCSGHYDLFHDFMVDCRESKKRYRHDQVNGRWVEAKGQRIFVGVSSDGEDGEKEAQQKALKFFNLRSKHADDLQWDGPLVSLTTVEDPSQVLGPDAKTLGTLTPPREFNLMFKTTIGALGSEDDYAFLRPETAQGIFANFKNVVDSTRVRVPFGIAQIGKSFRNEITPRNFTFRSREFEQMEIEFFCHPEESQKWYKYWRDRRYAWYVRLGLSEEKLRLREHDPKELAHYSVGTADIEYAFPFLAEGDFGELEGVAHRGDFDLRSHDKMRAEHGVEVGSEPGKVKYKGGNDKLSYYDDLRKETYFPHVIEPSAGADRAALAFLCEACQIDQAPDDKGKMQERTVLKLHPKLAPYKAAVLPLVRKDGLPEIAQDLYLELKKHHLVFYDDKGAVGRRYRRQDEAGTPFCFTIDNQTLDDKTITIRDRDSLAQDRIPLKDAVEELQKRLQL